MEKRSAAVLKNFTFEEQLLWQETFVNKKGVRLKCFPGNDNFFLSGAMGEY